MSIGRISLALVACLALPVAALVGCVAHSSPEGKTEPAPAPDNRPQVTYPDDWESRGEPVGTDVSAGPDSTMTDEEEEAPAEDSAEMAEPTDESLLLDDSTAAGADDASNDEPADAADAADATDGDDDEAAPQGSYSQAE